MRLSASCTNPQLARSLRQAEDAIDLDKYNTEAWTTLLTFSQTIAPISDDVRSVYELFFTLFPTSAKMWKVYMEAEVAAKRFDKVEAIVKRCLLQCLDVDLWMAYLSYVRTIKAGDPEEYTAVAAAFRFAVEHVGDDYHALPLWRRYLDFIQELPMSNAMERAEKNEKLRQVFQRAVVAPMEGVETIWKQYDVFEHTINATLAKGLLSSLKADHVTALTTSRERKVRRGGILPHLLARPVRLSKTGAIADQSQVELWVRYIRYEASNPQRLEAGPLKNRVRTVFKQASLTLRHFPEFWLFYIQHLRLQAARSADSMALDPLQAASTDPKAEVIEVMKEACAAMPYSLLMHFIYADFLEENKMYAEAKAVYESLYVTEKKGITLQASTSTSTSTAASASSSSTSSAIGSLSTYEGESGELTETNPLVYVQHMKFMRRTEGRDAARKVFLLARKSPQVTWQVYVAAAEMEHHTNAEPDFAAKIYSAGLNLFIGTPQYVFAYLDFLNAINDNTNQMAIFEKVLAHPDYSAAENVDVCDKIWERYIQFQRDVGESLLSIEKLQLRRNEHLGLLRAGDGHDKVYMAADTSNTALDRARAAASGTDPFKQGPGSAPMTAQEKVAAMSAASAMGGQREQTEPTYKLFMWDILERQSFLEMYPCSSVYVDNQQRVRADRVREAQRGSAGTADGDDIAVPRAASASMSSSADPMTSLRNLQGKQLLMAKARFPRPDLTLLAELTPQLATDTDFRDGSRQPMYTFSQLGATPHHHDWLVNILRSMPPHVVAPRFGATLVKLIRHLPPPPPPNAPVRLANMNIEHLIHCLGRAQLPHQAPPAHAPERFATLQNEVLGKLYLSDGKE